MTRAEITSWLESNFQGDAATARAVLEVGIKHFSRIVEHSHYQDEIAKAAAQLAKTREYLDALAALA